MSETILGCPTCGQPLEAVRQESDATTGAIAYLFRCVNQHWWQLTARAGWQPIEPDPEVVPDLVAPQP